jgi:hypothetical protein
MTPDPHLVHWRFNASPRAFAGVPRNAAQRCFISGPNLHFPRSSQSAANRLALSAERSAALFPPAAVWTKTGLILA